jgi:hypothetical protein
MSHVRSSHSIRSKKARRATRRKERLPTVSTRVYRKVGKKFGEKLPAYTSHGSYPLVYYTKHQDQLCADCASKPRYLSDPVTDVDVYYEGPPIECEDCGKEIQSAYGDPNENEGSPRRDKGPGNGSPGSRSCKHLSTTRPDANGYARCKTCHHPNVYVGRPTQPNALGTLAHEAASKVARLFAGSPLEGARKMVTAERLRVGNVIRVPSESGLSMVDAELIEKRPGRRVFTSGRAFNLIVKRVEPAHASDLGKQWRVYALDDDKFERRADS